MDRLSKQNISALLRNVKSKRMDNPAVTQILPYSTSPYHKIPESNFFNANGQHVVTQILQKYATVIKTTHMQI